MSVLIKGAKMPDYCEDCSLYDWVDPVCRVSGVDIDDENLRGCRPGWCPLVEVPEKHGDLIDRKVLSSAVLKWMPPDPCGKEEKEFPFGEDICVSMMMEIEEQPTIIEAEGKDEPW